MHIMNDSLALPPRLVIRDLLLTAFSQKARVVMICFCVMAISLAAAVMVQPDYKARSSLLVLLGTEHAFRPTAGQQVTNTAAVDAEQVLRTEASIISSDDLHRTVIREIGVEKLYPQLVKKPTAFEQWTIDVRQFITGSLGLSDRSTDAAAADPMARAIDLFARNLTITVDRKSSVIGLDFTNPDKNLSAQALGILVTQYLDLRTKLYGDVQAPIVQVQQDVVGKQLAAADAALETFKQQHDIGNFVERRAILSKQQGEMETALTRSESTVAEQTARLAQLNAQIGTGKKGAPANPTAALQSVVQAYQQRQEEAATRYRGSADVDDARRQLLERQTEVARMQASQAYTVQAERNKTDADLKASTAGHDTIVTQLAALKKQVSDLDAEEVRLHQLERGRNILEDNYRAVSKILDERQTVEAVEANRQSSVRMIQPPSVPAMPEATRRLILTAGAVVSLLLSIGSILLSHFLRASYLRPEALEMDTGLTVLASVPEMHAIGSSGSVLVVPS
jgi:uncharacterized protein involved in exopolysaccharide biosynthesis